MLESTGTPLYAQQSDEFMTKVESSTDFPLRHLRKAIEILLRPFESPENFLEVLSEAAMVFLSFQSKTGFLYLISGLVAAAIIYRFSKDHLPEAHRRSFFSYIFPKSVYAHPSAIVDYKYVSFDLLIRFFLYIPLINGLSNLVYNVLEARSIDLSFGLFEGSHPYIRIAVITVIGIAAVDFSVFFAHYLLHKVPLLWPFHEVHHSAEVLTPITVHRNHPVDELVNGIVYGIVGGLIASTYSSVSGQTVSEFSILGLNIFTFGYYLTVYQLRHSHIWLSYGPVLSHIFISPAQHQIHHSIERKHWNKNYGFTFALWDWMFGSLYVPREREEIHFGIPNIQRSDFATVPRLYFLPFRKSFIRFCKMLKAKSFRIDFDDVVLPAEKQPD